MSAAFQCERCHEFFPGQVLSKGRVRLYARSVEGPAIGYWMVSFEAHTSGGVSPDMCFGCVQESLRTAMREYLSVGERDA